MMVVACFVPAQSYRRPSDSNISNELDETEEHQSLIPSISSFPVGWISKAPTYLLQFFDLKLRFIKFITSLFTTDNLTLIKKFLNIRPSLWHMALRYQYRLHYWRHQLIFVVFVS
ncbi:hypothetical protein JTB14_001955 [Gonioctena quinquepunctata]|nr:hypothetical protein JTB14_001955 [Gonioctena quinquepunctata]